MDNNYITTNDLLNHSEIIQDEITQKSDKYNKQYYQIITCPNTNIININFAGYLDTIKYNEYSEHFLKILIKQKNIKNLTLKLISYAVSEEYLLINDSYKILNLLIYKNNTLMASIYCSFFPKSKINNLNNILIEKIEGIYKIILKIKNKNDIILDIFDNYDCNDKIIEKLFTNINHEELLFLYD